MIPFGFDDGRVYLDIGQTDSTRQVACPDEPFHHLTSSLSPVHSSDILHRPRCKPLTSAAQHRARPHHFPHTHLFLGARASTRPLQGPECLPVGRNQMLWQYVSDARYSSRSSPVPPSISRRKFKPILLIRVATLVLYHQALINAHVHA